MELQDQEMSIHFKRAFRLY